MNTLLTIAFIACAAAMCTREPTHNTRTLTQMWAPARANGWRRATLLALGGAAKLLLLIAAGLAALTFEAAGRACQAAMWVCRIIAHHLRSIAAYSAVPPIAVEAAA